MVMKFLQIFASNLLLVSEMMTFILEKPLSAFAELTGIAPTMVLVFLILGGIPWFSRFFSTFSE